MFYWAPITGFGIEFSKDILLTKNVLIAADTLSESFSFPNKLIFTNGLNKFKHNDLHASWSLDLVSKTYAIGTLH